MSIVRFQNSPNLLGATNHDFSSPRSAHQAPFDRSLIVQAKLTGSALVTPRKFFSRYLVNARWG